MQTWCVLFNKLNLCIVKDMVSVSMVTCNVIADYAYATIKLTVSAHAELVLFILDNGNWYQYRAFLSNGT